MKKTYLITGGSGFVGANLVKKIASTDAVVHVLTRKQKNNWRLSESKSNIHVHEVDLLDVKLVDVIKDINPQYVFHLASYGSLPVDNDIEKMLNINLLGTIRLVNAISKLPIKLFINTGSSSEYGTSSLPFKETDLLQPMNDYAVSKTAQTLYCQKEALLKNLPIITFRLFSPYGYYEQSTRLIPYVIIHALQNTNIPLSSKNFVRDFIFIEDVIDAYMRATHVSINPGEIFNIGSGQQHTLVEVVDIIISLLNSHSLPLWGTKEKQTRQIEPLMWQADISKAKECLSWQPKYSLTEGLKKDIEWFQKNNRYYDK